MHVCISGAGIAGPTLAFFLAKAGAHVTILERSPSILPHGQNIDISGSALSVIKKMGLMDELRRRNTTEKGTIFVDSEGRPFASFPVKEGRKASFTSEFEILRGDLAKMLYESAKDHPNVKYLLGVTQQEVISNDDTTVKIRLSNGEIHDFDILVAADGQWSKIRKNCFPADYVKVIDLGAYVVYWTTPRLPRDNDCLKVYQALRSRVINLRPDPYGTIRATFSCMPCNKTQKEAWQRASKGDRQTQEDLVQREFADAGWETQRLLDSMDQAQDFYFQAIQQIKMVHWSNCRIVCLGDTAYAPTPFTGMGTSLAITGAYVLAGEISKLGKGEHPIAAFEAFESSFRPFVEKTQKIPFFIPGIAHPETAWKRRLLQTLVWAVSKILALVFAIPWFDKTSEQGIVEDFPLASYPSFDARVST